MARLTTSSCHFADYDVVWNDYVRWLANSASTAQPDVLLDSYLAHMLQIGVPVLEAHLRMEALAERMSYDCEAWRLLFNTVYAGIASTAAIPPNAFMTTACKQLRPGHALDVCMGNGRNSIYLASHGWQVTGFDVAETGLSAARVA